MHLNYIYILYLMLILIKTKRNRILVGWLRSSEKKSNSNKKKTKWKLDYAKATGSQVIKACKAGVITFQLVVLGSLLLWQCSGRWREQFRCNYWVLDGIFVSPNYQLWFSVGDCSIVIWVRWQGVIIEKNTSYVSHVS